MFTYRVEWRGVIILVIIASDKLEKPCRCWRVVYKVRQ